MGVVTDDSATPAEWGASPGAGHARIEIARERATLCQRRVTVPHGLTFTGCIDGVGRWAGAGFRGADRGGGKLKT